MGEVEMLVYDCSWFPLFAGSGVIGWDMCGELSRVYWVFEIVRIKRVQFLGDDVDVNGGLQDGIYD